jgi:hypothetical protein
MGQDTAQLRRSAALRVLVAVLTAGGLTTLVILVAWGPLDVHTDVIGYPVFKDFNVYNYFNTYYLIVGLFPLAALLIFLGLTRLAPKVGLVAPLKRGPLRPAFRPAEDRPRLAGEQPLTEAPQVRRRVVSAARVGFVGAVLGLETGIVINSIRPGLALGFAAYSLAAVVAASLLGRRLPGWSLEARLAAVNSFGALLTIGGLIGVSTITKVVVLSNGSVDHYPWLPLWLGLPVVAAIVAAVALALRRPATPARAFQIERKMLLLVAAPACLYLLLAQVPGESGYIDYFHGGEQIEGSYLVEHGGFPWRDVALTHGLFQDVIYSFGRSVFGDSIWGQTAGVAMIMKPLYLISVFFLLVYLVGRNWLFLFFAGILMIGPWVAPEQFRLILWPLILILLATDLDRPARWKSVGLGFLLVAQTILTPEAAPALLAVAVVLVLYEWYWRQLDDPIPAVFSRTLWFAGSCIAFASLFAGYLAANHALDDFIYVSRNLVHGHTLSGGTPPMPSADTVSDVGLGFLALIPVAALLISFGYAVARLRLRRPFYTEDWVMGAAAIFLLVYYTKFLARMDTGHVYQPFVAGLPLFFYIAYRVVAAGEAQIRERWPLNAVLRATTHPFSLALVVLVAVLNWSTIHNRAGQAPAFYRPAVTAPPQLKRVGYTQVFPTTAYRDLKRVVDAYLSPDDRLFDFSNTPLLFFYLMGRYPSTRYFHVSLTYSTELQADVIRRLSKARPKLIVFDNDSTPFVALSNWDGIPNMVRSYDISQWILDHYRPLLWTHGITIYARRDMPPASAVDLHLADKPATRGIPFTVQPCTWGSSPNFLSGPGMPPPGATGVGARAHPAPERVTVSGWAGDPHAKLPAREVVAIADGRIVGRVKPKIDRPDVVAYGLPQGFERSGYRMQIQVPPKEGMRVFGVSRDGDLTQLVSEGEHPAKGTVRVDGRRVRIKPNAVWGQVNSKAREHALQISRPLDSSWTDYRWLEVDAGEDGFRPGTFTVYDRQARPSAEREISFQTLDDSPRSYVVPVGSCSQWHGYRGRRLFLNFDTPQDVSAVRLIR